MIEEYSASQGICVEEHWHVTHGAACIWVDIACRATVTCIRPVQEGQGRLDPKGILTILREGRAFGPIITRNSVGSDPKGGAILVGSIVPHPIKMCHVQPNQTDAVAHKFSWTL